MPASQYRSFALDLVHYLALVLTCLAPSASTRAQTPHLFLPAPQIKNPAGLTPSPSATPQVERNVLFRPIAHVAGARRHVDRSYPYGSTQLNLRSPHLGVEFVNPRGTPVIAAQSGTVVFAGADAETLIGPRLDYYGNVVILAHDWLSRASEPVFTLYGHLESIAVAAGDEVEARAPVGAVGLTGIAIGAHLHFEVRVGDPFDFRMTRNPELWLRHRGNRGLLIGSLRAADGALVPGWRVTVRKEGASRDVYTYEGEHVNSDPAWGENFSAGDLEAGDYEIVVLNRRGGIAFRETVTIEARRVAMIDIRLEP